MKTWIGLLALSLLAGCINQPATAVDENQSAIELRKKPKNDTDKNDTGQNCRWESIRIVEGCWNVLQTNPTALITGLLKLTQAGSAISGTMDWVNFSDATADGKVSGDSVSFALTYPDIPGLIGYYDAILDATGENLANGTTVSNNGHSGTWQATKTACPVGP